MKSGDSLGKPDSWFRKQFLAFNKWIDEGQRLQEIKQKEEAAKKKRVETSAAKIAAIASSIDLTRYSDTKRVAGLLFCVLAGPGGAEVDKIQKGPCPYCGGGTSVMRTPGKFQNLFHCDHCKKPIIYDYRASRFYAVKGH